MHNLLDVEDDITIIDDIELAMVTNKLEIR